MILNYALSNCGETQRAVLWAPADSDAKSIGIHIAIHSDVRSVLKLQPTIWTSFASAVKERFTGERCFRPVMRRCSSRGLLMVFSRGEVRMGVPRSTQGCNGCGLGRQGVDVHY